MNNRNRFYIVTGGPGSGKTALIEALRARGSACAIEAGRGIIQDQMKIEGRALPWCDPILFAELMLSWEMRSYHAAEQTPGSVFFDRGVPDVMGYLRLVGSPVPAHVLNAAAAFRYNPLVFITPPWKEIFRQDQERKQDFNEAIRTYEALAATYTDLNYQLIQIPLVPVSERVTFVLSQIKIDDQRS